VRNASAASTPPAPCVRPPSVDMGNRLSGSGQTSIPRRRGRHHGATFPAEDPVFDVCPEPGIESSLQTKAGPGRAVYEPDAHRIEPVPVPRLERRSEPYALPMCKQGSVSAAIGSGEDCALDRVVRGQKARAEPTIIARVVAGPWNPARRLAGRRRNTFAVGGAARPTSSGTPKAAMARELRVASRWKRGVPCQSSGSSVCANIRAGRARSCDSYPAGA
jgi:hypothetical protein